MEAHLSPYSFFSHLYSPALHLLQFTSSSSLNNLPQQQNHRSDFAPFFPLLSVKPLFTTMKIITNFPKKLFNKYKKQSKSRSASRSNKNNPLNSLSYSATDSSSTSSSISSKKKLNLNGLGTPNSVLPSTPTNDVSADEWSEFSADVYFEIEEAFKTIDTDGDGKITRDELAAFLIRVANDPPSSEEMSMLLGEVDRNEDGCISLEEFGAISSAFGPPACGAELKDAFDFFDSDHDGRITAEELYYAFIEIGNSRCTLEDCRRMIDGVDKNGDGFVCFTDFCHMMELQR